MKTFIPDACVVDVYHNDRVLKSPCYVCQASTIVGYEVTVKINKDDSPEVSELMPLPMMLICDNCWQHCYGAPYTKLTRMHHDKLGAQIQQ